MKTSLLVVAAFALAAFRSCEPGWSQPVPAQSLRKVLPAPQRSGGPALATVLARRHSVRAFGHRELLDTELAQLCWAAQGVSDGHRTAPSAGALYPLTVRVVDAGGVWRYLPSEHVLVRDDARDRRAELAAATGSQGAVRGAPAILIITADVAITAHKYGPRAERYATLEAGHVAQNVLLEATALDLGAVTVGAFDDEVVRRALGLPSAETPLYVIPVGAPP